MDKINKILFLALFISIAAHFLFFVFSPYIVFPVAGVTENDVNFLFRLGEVDKVVERAAARREERVIELTMPGKSAKKGVMELEDMFIGENIKESAGRDDREDIKDIVKDDNFFYRNTDIKENMLDAESSKAKKESEVKRKSLIEDSAKPEEMVKDAVGGMDIKEMEYDIKREGFKWSNVAADISEKIKTGAKEPSGIIPGKGSPGNEGAAGDISAFLDTKLYVYEDTLRKEKYFKLVIKARQGLRIDSMPKEVIFLIDSSKSMTSDKFIYVKKAVINAIRNMKPDDKFNIVSFRGELSKFREKSVNVNREMINEAATFIKNLEASGETDVYGSLLNIVKEGQDFSPSYIIMVTDGRPTTGLTDSKAIIREITSKNSMKRPIFSFGAGSRVNKYLLDFISYQNRAWSTFAARVHDSPNELGRLNTAIMDPLLLNLRYRIINLSDNEVYPKYLPDFYRGSEFKLYGRFTDEDVFSMQVVGDIPSKSILRKYDYRELIFRESLKEAIQGDETIAREWAFRKIYHLISQDTINEKTSRNINTEIEWLANKYGIGRQYDIDRPD